MTLRSSFLAPWFLLLALAACGNPCKQLQDEFQACARGLDCTTKEGQDRVTCETVKGGGFVPVPGIQGDDCSGNVRIAAEACLLKGLDPAKNCSCE